MKTAILALTFAFLSTFPLMASAMDKINSTDSAVIKAIAFHADTCGACKILAPKVEEAMKDIDQDKINRVKFDFSNKDSIAATRTLAEKEKAKDILYKYGAKTGFVVLVNQQGEIVDTLNASDTTEEITAKLSKAIANAG